MTLGDLTLTQHYIFHNRDVLESRPNEIQWHMLNISSLQRMRKNLDCRADMDERCVKDCDAEQGDMP